MEQVLALRPFLPAKDLKKSVQFYQEIGFALTLEEASLAFLKMDSFSIILMDSQGMEIAEPRAVQMLVRNADAWWARINAPALMATYQIRPPPAPPPCNPGA